MTILAATQTATVNITVPGSYLTITCATGEVMQVDWVSPGSITGTRIVRQVTEDVGPFTDSTVVTLRALMGNPQYTDGLGGGLTAAQVAAVQSSVTSGAWRGFQSVTMRLRMGGTGTVVMDSATGDAGSGTVTTAQYSYSPAGTQVDDFAYPGDNAKSIRITLTGTATCEVI